MRIRIREPRKDFMRVSTAFLDCVGFVAERIPLSEPDTYDYDFLGTGFCVSVNGHYGLFYYFVTASHVLGDLPQGKTALILNKKGGGVTQIQPCSAWHRHPDPSVDAAVLPFNYEPALDVLPVPADIFLRSEWLGKKSNMGIGSDVFSVGLFSVAPGKTRNVPIVRYGNLAMLPDSPIQVKSGFAEVYLIEARSIGGISGSPVFVTETVSFQFSDPQGKLSRIIGLGERYKLLGLMHGHWDIEERDLNNPRINPVVRGVNLGIGIVVPAPKLLEIIYGPALTEARDEFELEIGKKLGVVPHPG